jgi:RNA polymerase sigma-70 factor (ECF subfamily)
MSMSVDRAAFSRPQEIDFQTLAERHLDDVYGYLLYLTKSPSLAEELTGACFERALRRFPSYDSRRGEARSWLLQLARSSALDHFRSESRRRRREQEHVAGLPLSAQDPEPFANVLPAPLAEALSTLSALDRELVFLRVVLELENARTAKLLNLTPTACATRLSRALAKLEEKVNRDEL